MTEQGPELGERDLEARRAIEAVVLAVTEPIEPTVLAQLVELPVARVEDVLAVAEAAHDQLTEILELHDVDHALLVELEHREEPHHHLEPGLDAGDEGTEAHGLRRGEQAQQRLDRVADAGAHRGDVFGVDDRLGLGRQHAQRGGAQRGGADPLQRVGDEPTVGLLRPGEAGHTAAGAARHRVEGERGVLERLALEQPREQEVALLEAEQLFVELGVVETREEAARLQLHEGGRDEEELGGDVEIERLHAVELGEVLVDDARERHLPEVDLLLEDQVQQEVEGPLVDAGVDVQNH